VPGFGRSLSKSAAALVDRRLGCSAPLRSVTTAAYGWGMQSVRSRREALVREHMEAENVHDFDTVIATFDHPRYELIATGQVHDGEEAVRGYFASTRGAFPDQRNELIAMHSTDDGVWVEFDLLGTHQGEFLGFEPTGKAFRCRMAAFFAFEGEKIVAERVYFDALTILNQLGLA